MVNSIFTLAFYLRFSIALNASANPVLLTAIIIIITMQRLPLDILYL